MKRLVESVPNFSEGRRQDVIADIRAAVSAVSGVALLDLSSDPDHNRSVLTIAGDDEALFTATMALFERAVARIDLREHQGGHPRMGAVDVVPFIPIRGVSMDDCVALSKRVGEAVASRFGIPVFLYEESAASEARRNLATIRKGEFEGFAAKIKKADWRPDFGHSEIHPSAGVVAIGARPFLIAYNINLATSDLKIAERIAKAIRHSSGGYRFVKAMGVALEARGIVQVSINMTDFRRTPLHRVFDTVRSEAERHGVSVVGSEIVGLVPRDALLASAEHYLRLETAPESVVLENRLEDE